MTWYSGDGKKIITQVKDFKKRLKDRKVTQGHSRLKYIRNPTRIPKKH